ncbi:nucleoid-associated protein [Lutispora saccharofermentans]|uniref:Nucleoid-associated protein n=1 Tax=Lutispora saccharofermentans TaxID=3024236 RepID=A0ABT1NK09_9FIRM|nr:nucleoid-associated protein [Lutispora saccharofermentans]MCQ1531599.1 nucleoid-associated protein [Lutispora saccharofermentans]
MDKENIKVTNAIVHILDSSLDVPVLSNELLDLNEEIEDFIKIHIFKILSGDNYKVTQLDDHDNYCYKELKAYLGNNDFIAATENLSLQLFSLMKKNVDIPAADIIFTTFNYEGDSYFSMLKMNYKSSYIHFVETIDTGTKNTIVKQKTVLPSEAQSLEEVIIIDLDDFSVKLVEKKYLINGEKEYYLSQYYLGCQPELSSKSKLDIVTKTADRINKKHFNDDIEKKMQFKKILLDNYEANGTVNVDNVINEVFENNIDVKNEFKEKIMNQGLDKKEFQIQSKSSFKKLERQVIKTDTGIEINIPLDQYGDRDRLEFITNTDGTISILIKNVGKLIGR